VHAPPGRGLTRAAAGAAALVLAAVGAGCTSGSSDAGAVPEPSTSVTLPGPQMGGPVVTFTGDTAEVAGHYPASVALAQVSSSLPANCQPTLERSDDHLVSVRWNCGSRVAAATVSLDGRRLTLGDILTGDYASYLTSVATQQLRLAGASTSGTDDLSTWYLTPAALAVVFPGGVVTYPLASLSSFLSDPSGL
jgi:hypothetical protein